MPIIYRFLELSDAGIRSVREDIERLLSRLVGETRTITEGRLLETIHHSVWRVAEEDETGAIIGMAVFMLNDSLIGKRGCISNVSVADEQNGLEVAGHLIADLLKEAARKGCDSVSLPKHVAEQIYVLEDLQVETNVVLDVQS